jgi:DNA polymerase III alpha subunit
LKQWHLYSERQAHLQGIQGEQQQLHAKAQAEQAEQVKKFLSEQQEQLLAKLPEWKDATKAKAEQSAIREYLKSQGLEDAQVDNISDHRVVLLSRKAMLYDQMLEKATKAVKEVEKKPAKVERPGGGETNALDGRTQAMKQLQRTGKVEDAARVFADFL